MSGFFRQSELASDPIEGFSEVAGATGPDAHSRGARRARLASRSRSDSRRRPRVSPRPRTGSAVPENPPAPHGPAFLPAVPLQHPHLLPGEQMQFVQGLLARQQVQLSDLALEISALRRVAAEQQMLASHRLDEMERRLRHVDALLLHIMQHLQVPPMRRA